MSVPSRSKITSRIAIARILLAGAAGCQPERELTNGPASAKAMAGNLRGIHGEGGAERGIGARRERRRKGVRGTKSPGIS